MAAASPAEALLSGPRGRALCWSVALGRHGGTAQLHELARSGDVGGARAWLLGRAGTMDLAALAATTGELAFLGDLADVVTSAVYWQQPPDEATGRVLAGDAVCDALLPVADAILAAPGTRWWASPAALDGQRYAQFLGAHALGPPRLSGAGSLLGTWRSGAAAAEERAALERPGDPAAPWSGHWWSSPSLSGLPVTTRVLPGLGAARLVLVEDGMAGGRRAAGRWRRGPMSGYTRSVARTRGRSSPAATRWTSAGRAATTGGGSPAGPGDG